MKKILTLLVICIALVLTFSGCIDPSGTASVGNNSGSQNTSEAKLTAEYVYELAKSSGYTGTLDEFIAEFKGEDGKDGQNGEE